MAPRPLRHEAGAVDEDGDVLPEVDLVEEFKDHLRSLLGEWYVIHTYAGYENRVKSNLESAPSRSTWRTTSSRSRCPTQRSTEIKNGKRKNVQEQVLPGYVLVRMELTDESWGVVRNTPGVTGFVGNAYNPYPLSLDEIVKMLAWGRGAVRGGRRSRRPRPRPGRGPGATSRSATRSPSRTARSRRCRRRSTRSTPTRRRSRSWSRSSVARPRSSCSSTRSRRTDRIASN